METEADQSFIYCPPLDKYPIAPKDQKNCIVSKCAHCNKDMWLSERKRFLIKKVKNLWIGCYVCFYEYVKDNRNDFINKEPIDITNLNISEH